MNKQIALLISRLLLGIFFFFQGYGKVFKWGVDQVYQNFFLKAYQDQLPEWILWSTAYFTSFAELVGGFLLIIGLKRDWILYTLGLVLIIVSIGHGLKDPIWDLSHVMYRFILIFILLITPKDWDNIRMDYFLKSKS
jgi:putative oxidoreductase